MEQASLFDDRETNNPLASRMRPKTLDEFIGQDDILGNGKVLRNLVENDEITSMILWGPPGVGKTTIATIIAEKTNAHFVNYSAVTSGIKEIKDVMNKAEENRKMGEKTVLFVDEIHRFNKAQQDAFLPYVEKGSIILIGATTENPSFHVNSALMSRCKVFVLNSLTVDNLVDIMKNALISPRGYDNQKIDINEDILKSIATFSNGDARTCLNTLELCITSSPIIKGKKKVTRDILEQCLSNKVLLYDKDGEEHYNLISALHKSMRNSDVNAAIYWLARMLEAGEDPLYIARRVIRFSSEDIGLADPNAMSIANTAYECCHKIGMPECSVNLCEAVVYMCLAPKSNSMEIAYLTAKKDALNMLNEPVPLNIRNAPTKLMANLNYGKGYIYAHDTKDKIADLQCMPDNLVGREYYYPTTQGKEIRFKERYEWIKKWHIDHDKK